MQEKREHPRLPVDETISWSEQEDGPSLSAQVLDVSEGGLRVRFDQEPEEGAVVYLEMDLLTPDFGDSGTAAARVQHRFRDADGWQAGLKLVEPHRWTPRPRFR